MEGGFLQHEDRVQAFLDGERQEIYDIDPVEAAKTNNRVYDIAFLVALGKHMSEDYRQPWESD